MYGIEHVRLMQEAPMPPVSQAQRRLMHAAANDPKVAKKTGVPRSVAKEYAAADKPGKLPARKNSSAKKR